MIEFYGEVIKANHSDLALDKLRSFLDKDEPKLVKLLQNTWNVQGDSITYKEIREALLYARDNAGLNDVERMTEWLYDWQKDYSRFVVRYLAPTWADSMKAAQTQLQRKFPEFAFNPAEEGVRRWTDQVSAAFVTNTSQVQIEAIREVVKRSAQLGTLTVDELSHVIRPMVGLTKQQAASNLNYYNAMRESGVSQGKAVDRSIRYSARQSRYRGYNIARTELAFSYNQGEHFGVLQAQEQGLMGQCEKEWCTAADERVCKSCGSLEGTRIHMDADFGFNTRLNYPGIKKTPPAHPSCRCAVQYIEVAPPIF